MWNALQYAKAEGVHKGSVVALNSVKGSEIRTIMEKTMSTWTNQPAPKFVDPAGTYTGGYTSNIRHPNTARGSNQRGIIQVNCGADTTVEYQGKVHHDAPWVTVKTYSASTIEESVLMPFMRVVVGGTAGDATVYITESK